MIGKHCIRTYSSTQTTVSLSSGEAEYYGIVKGSSNALGLIGMLGDIGVCSSVVVCTDASAAKGIASRRGLGKVRHIELCELWLQDQVARGKIQLVKICGEDNISDSLTKPPDADRILQTMRWTHHSVECGRHAIMPNVVE